MENITLSGLISASAFQSSRTSGVIVTPQEVASQDQQTAVTEQQSREEKFREQDSSGIGVAIIAMSVVISALALLAIIFIVLGRIMHKRAKPKTSAPEAPKVSQQQVRASAPSAGEGGEMAAIAMAIWEYERSMGDQESGVITIDEELQSHSGWNARVQSVMGNQLSR